MNLNTIWFLTDFGLADEWVAVCKAVIYQRAPRARVCDITHLIPPYNIKAGALLLRNAALIIGPAIYLAVVDPGVGSKRRGVALETKNGAFLVGPDNGLLMPAAEVLGGVNGAVHLTNEKYWRHPVCPTFHARDIFAPVAACLASGIALEELGEVISLSTLSPAPWGPAKQTANGFIVEVIHIDGFGTVRFNLTAADLSQAGVKPGQTLTFQTAKQKISARLVKTFADGQPDEPLFLIDSSELLCLAINQGSAAKQFNLSLQKGTLFY